MEKSENENFEQIVEINVKMIICSTSPPGGNQVDGLPPVLHNNRAITILPRGGGPKNFW